MEAIDFLKECKDKEHEALQRLTDSFSGEEVERDEFLHVLVGTYSYGINW